MFAVLLLCLVGLAVSQQPQPCTTPPQWEARVFELNEQRGFMVRGRLTYDSTYHRRRFFEDDQVGRNETFYDTISLFESGVEYVYNLRLRNCTRRPLTRPWRDFGIRPDAISLGEAYIGSSAFAGTGLLASLWNSTHVTPFNDTVRTFGTWTYQGCLPVRFIDHSVQMGRTQISFYDITLGIRDPSVFIPRPECLTE